MFCLACVDVPERWLADQTLEPQMKATPLALLVLKKRSQSNSKVILNQNFYEELYPFSDAKF
jgi:hypothetical protein